MLSSLMVIKNGHIAIFSSVRFEMIALAKICTGQAQYAEGYEPPKITPPS